MAAISGVNGLSYKSSRGPIAFRRAKRLESTSRIPPENHWQKSSGGIPPKFRYRIPPDARQLSDEQTAGTPSADYGRGPSNQQLEARRRSASVVLSGIEHLWLTLAS